MYAYILIIYMKLSAVTEELGFFLHANPPSLTLWPPLYAPGTYMHLRIELLGRRGGFIGPGDVAVSGQILLAVGCVPGVFACRPWKRCAEGGQQVIQSPGHDGVVVEGNVQGNNADGKANTYKRDAVKEVHRLHSASSVFHFRKRRADDI